MNRLSFALAALVCTVTLLFAEDVWKKPFTDWSEKDANKLLQNSPWAHEVSVSLGGGMGGGGGRRQRGGGSMGEAEGVGGSGGGSRGGMAGGGGAGMGGVG